MSRPLQLQITALEQKLGKLSAQREGLLREKADLVVSHRETLDMRERAFEAEKEELRAEIQSLKSAGLALEDRVTRQSQELGQAKAARAEAVRALETSVIDHVQQQRRKLEAGS